MTKAKKLEELRQKLGALQKEREAAILEKGLQAQDNNDLRENFAYILWEQKEHMLTSKIHNLIREIEHIAKS